MEAVIEHLQDNAVAYVFGLVVVVPIVIFFRRWLVPIFQWMIEIAIYATGLHVAVHFVTALIAWFQRAASSEYLETGEGVDWSTPLLQFWDMEAYNPVGIFYFEVAVVIGITILVIKIRPFRVQRSQSAAHNRSQRRSVNRNPRARR